MGSFAWISKIDWTYRCCITIKIVICIIWIGRSHPLGNLENVSPTHAINMTHINRINLVPGLQKEAVTAFKITVLVSQFGHRNLCVRMLRSRIQYDQITYFWVFLHKDKSIKFINDQATQTIPHYRKESTSAASSLIYVHGNLEVFIWMHKQITEIIKKKVVDDEQIWKGSVYRLSSGK